MGNGTSSPNGTNSGTSSPTTTKTGGERLGLKRHLLRESWHIISSKTGDERLCIRKFYQTMMERGGDRIRRLFAFTDMQRQEHMIGSIVRWAIGNEYDVVGLRKLGVYHAHLGVSPEDLDLFNQAFCDTLKSVGGPDWKPEYDEAWTETMSAIAAAMSPTMTTASGVIDTVTNETSKEKELASAHTSLVAWFSETGAKQESSFFNDDFKAFTEDIKYAAMATDAKGFGELKIRTIDVHGRILYVKKGTQNVRVIDLGLVSNFEGNAPNHAEDENPIVPDEYIVTVTIGKSVIHQFHFFSESRYEEFLILLRRATHQFGQEEPAPEFSQLDLANNEIFSDKVHLNFVPEDFVYKTLLGRGSFGKVVKVMHKSTNKIYAMKVIHKNSFRSVRNVIEVRRERAILESVNHPFIVKFYGVFQSEEKLYFLFDFLSGGELFHHTKNAPGHHFSEDACRFYLAEIACALEHLRKHKIIHRDIKGDNFVLDRDGHVVLTDFGFAKVLENKRRNKSTCGTLAYIAPEVIAPTPMGYNYEVDWWSMGVVMFTMLTGFFPFLRPKPQETAKAIVRDSLRFPPKPQLSKEAQDVCRQLLKKKPYERISTLAQLKQHPFYAGFDWEALESKKMPPPFKPDPTGSSTKYFSKKYTKSEDVTVPDHIPKPGSPHDLDREVNVFSSFFFAQEAAGSVHEASSSDDDDESNSSTDGFARASTSSSKV